MRLLTPEQSRNLDRDTFARPGFSSADFIERAGQGVFQKLIELKKDPGHCLVLAGTGHNGDDARVVARELKNRGLPVLVLEFSQLPASAEFFDSFDTVVDGFFGVGLNRSLDTEVATFVDSLNQARRQRRTSVRPLWTLAIDVPSGLNALTGNRRGAAVEADHTVTMQAAKPGFFQNEGPGCVGTLSILPLPYPENLFRRWASTHFASGRRAAQLLIPRRQNFSHKGDYGTVNLVASSHHYPGAGVLCARAALRAGAGFVRFIQFEEGLFPEWFSIPETLFEKWSQVPVQLDKKATWVIGPGLESSPMLIKLLSSLREQGCEDVTLDAGAFVAIQKMSGKLPSSWLLTPHPKELAGLLGQSTAWVQEDRFRAARVAQEKWGATILLKGFKTIVQSQEKSFVILKGNAALAKAGSGDVLAGLLGSLRAQGLKVQAAAVLGSLLQGLAAELWLQKGDMSSLNPSDLIELLPLVQKDLKASV